MDIREIFERILSSISKDYKVGLEINPSIKTANMKITNDLNKRGVELGFSKGGGKSTFSIDILDADPPLDDRPPKLQIRDMSNP